MSARRSTKSVILALVTLATATLFVHVRVDHPLLMLLFLVAISTGFCLLGFAIGIWAKNFEQLQIVPMLVVTPLTFLGGAFYSINALGEPWRTVTLFNPIVYLISGFRWTFFGIADVPVWASVAVMAGDHRCSAGGDRLDVPDRLSAEAVARGSRRPAWSARLDALAVEVLGDEVPVDDVLEDRLQRSAAARCDSRCNRHAPTHRSSAAASCRVTTGVSASWSEVTSSLPLLSTSQPQPLAKWLAASVASFSSSASVAAEVAVDHLGELARRAVDACSGARHCQKKLWFQICAVLLNRPLSPSSLAALITSISEAPSRPFSPSSRWSCRHRPCDACRGDSRTFRPTCAAERVLGERKSGRVKAMVVAPAGWVGCAMLNALAPARVASQLSRAAGQLRRRLSCSLWRFIAWRSWS